MRFFHVLRLRFIHVLRVGPNQVHGPQKRTIFQLKLRLHRASKRFCHRFFSRRARVFFTPCVSFFTSCVSFIYVFSTFLFTSCAHLGYVTVSCGSGRLGRQAISSIPSKSKHLSNCSSTKTTSQALSRPLSRLPILNCPPICRIRMSRRRTYRLRHHPPRFNPRCLPHFKRGGR